MIGQHPLIGAWHENARCRGVTINVFFTSASLTSKEPAIICCAQCKVRTECLEDAYAIEDPINTYGIRAGLTAEQRMRLWHRRRFNSKIMPDLEWAKIEARYRSIDVSAIASIDRRKKNRKPTLGDYQFLKEAILSGRLRVYHQLRRWTLP